MIEMWSEDFGTTESQVALAACGSDAPMRIGKWTMNCDPSIRRRSHVPGCGEDGMTPSRGRRPGVTGPVCSGVDVEVAQFVLGVGIVHADHAQDMTIAI